MRRGSAALLAFPMHGQHKMSNEGYRTRDGHMIEWFGRKLRNRGDVRVISRPEPIILAPMRRVKQATVADNTKPITSLVWKVPSLRDRQRWWVTSLGSYSRAVPDVTTPVITWNPFLSLSDAWPRIASSSQRIAFDLLDDWTIHFAFAGVHDEVENAYRRLFERADVITANAEGTVELAKRFGRDDVVLLTNGCDPERFDNTSTATGPLTVGYVGKIGKRLDLELIAAAARALPDVNFVFAGPILDQEYRRPMEERPNITMLGDVHYEDVPQLLRTFDVGWVPHRVGEGEVGGDVIKTYEYRAAGLPVLSTPIQGARARALDGVQVLEPIDHIQAIVRLREAHGDRVPRQTIEIAPEMTWAWKADRHLENLGFVNYGESSRDDVQAR